MTIKKATQYREIWMGFAMLWIMLFHSGIILHNNLLLFVKEIGCAGVDVFLFASGIGNYYSYTKDEALLPFLKRRLRRLAPIYIPFIIVWCIYEIMIGKLSPIYILGNILAVQPLSRAGVYFNWYIGFLIICYVLTPYLATFVKTHNLRKCFLLVLTLILMTTAFWTDKKSVVFVSRLPIFAIGMICAKYDYKEINRNYVLLGGLLFVLGNAALFLCSKCYPQYQPLYGIYYYSFILITPFLCFLLSSASDWGRNHRFFNWLDKTIKIIGKSSFEVYLVHVFVFEYLLYVWDALKIKLNLNNSVWIIAYAAAFLGAWILHIVSKQIKKF